MFPLQFFDRADPGDDREFYAFPRFVTHIDDPAVEAVGRLYEELGIAGRVLDLMSSWVSHFRTPPAELVGVGMNASELSANPLLAESWVQDLNRDPVLPLPAACVDHAVCCVSVDYLTRPVEVFRDVGRVLCPRGLFVVTFSDRCFPTKAIRGWLATDDAGHEEIVRTYFRESGRFDPPSAGLRTPPGSACDPLYAVWAQRAE
ncbi:MAG: methyltransferase domain-containing protein [Actinomycetota bacterium]